jgi:peptidoglycan hydrolase CwlO-like protein
MATPHHADCDKCEEHMAWEERLKILNNIPKLMTWMNITKGVMIVLGLLVSMVLGIVVTSRTELEARQEKYEKYLEAKHERLTDQVLSISRDASDIKMHVAVLVGNVEAHKREITREVDNVKATCNNINIRKESR